MSAKDQITSEPDSPKKKGGFARFLYNSDTKQVLGRTGSSWAKIGLFYLVFYACLAAFFAIMLAVFLETLKSNEPRWQLDESRIGDNPGMGYEPKPNEDNIDSTLIQFVQGADGDWKQWSEKIKDYIKALKKKRDKGSGSAKICDLDTTKLEKDQVCHSDINIISSGDCIEKEEYGYKNGKPCVIVKLNKIFGWAPKPYDVSDLKDVMSARLAQNYSTKAVMISCDGENSADKENIGEIAVYPPYGLLNNFFPYTNQDNYEAPFVFVHFMNPTTGVLINVECRAWAKNIKFDKPERLGSVHFELLID